MSFVNMLEAKSSLSRLFKSVEQGRKCEIVITRNGRPAAKLVAIDADLVGQRLGIARGKFKVADSIDALNAEIAQLFSGGHKS